MRLQSILRIMQIQQPLELPLYLSAGYFLFAAT